MAFIKKNNYFFEKRFIIFAILALSLILRLYRLDFQSLWIDEVLTVISSEGSLSEVITQTEINTNILPLYYVIVNGFLQIAETDFMARLPSVLFGVLSIVFFYLFVKNWLDNKTALTGALLMGISPFHLWYSQEARPYMLFLCLALLSIWLLQLILQNNREKWIIPLFIVVTAASFYTHLIAISLFIFLTLYIVIADPVKDWKKWVYIGTIIIILLIPGLLKLHTFPPNASADAQRIFSPSFVAYTGWVFSTGYSLGPTVTELHLPERLQYVIDELQVIIPISLLFVTLLIKGFANLKNDHIKIFAYTVLLFLIPLGLTFAGSVLSDHPFNIRYAILSFPAFIIGISYSLTKFKSETLSIFFAISIIIISLVSVKNYYWNTKYHKEDSRAAAEYLEAHSKKDDIIIVNVPYMMKPLQFYLDNPDRLNIIGFPSEGKLNFEKVSNELERIVNQKDYFWLYLSRTFHSDLYDQIEEFCDRHYQMKINLSWTGIILNKYEI
jgi:uncharacterized membrane protein